MFNRIRFGLRMGATHAMYSLILWDDWHEFGEKNFQFEVLDTLDQGSVDGYNDWVELAELLSLWKEKMPGCAYR